MAKNKPPFWIVFVAHLKADPRKTGILVLLGLVMVGVYARVLFKPDDASASEDTSSLLPADTNKKGSQEASSASSQDSQEPEADRLVLSNPPTRQLHRNPFLMNHRDWGTSTEETTDNNLADPQGRLAEAAEEMTLQSTIVANDRPIACINNIFVQQGQRINGFLVEKIEPTQVTLRQSDYVVTLLLMN